MSDLIQQPTLTRGQFLLGGAAALGVCLIPPNLLHGKKENDSGIKDLPKKAIVHIPELTDDEALDALEYWNVTDRAQAGSSIPIWNAEPPLSLLLALLIYKVKNTCEETEREPGYSTNPAYTGQHRVGLRTFFNQVRLQRILIAVASGEADQSVREALQIELNKTGGHGGPQMLCGPRFSFFYAYIKTWILKCYDPIDLESIGFISSRDTRVQLDDLLSIPFRDLYHERKPPSKYTSWYSVEPTLNPTKDEVEIVNLNPITAIWHLQAHTSGTDSSEPTLSALLSVLLYVGDLNGIPEGKGVDERGPLSSESAQLYRGFFNGYRLQRIISAVLSGEAGEKVKDNLQEKLHDTATYKIGDPDTRKLGDPHWAEYRGWLKKRILDCFEHNEENSYKAAKYQRVTVGLESLLKQPLRDLFVEIEQESVPSAHVSKITT